MCKGARVHGCKAAWVERWMEAMVMKSGLLQVINANEGRSTKIKYLCQVNAEEKIWMNNRTEKALVTAVPMVGPEHSSVASGLSSAKTIQIMAAVLNFLSPANDIPTPTPHHGLRKII